MPISGGVTASGHRIFSRIEADRALMEIEGLKSSMPEILSGLLPLFETRGYTEQMEIEAHLLFTALGYAVLFPQFDIQAQISYGEHSEPRQ
jgi:hypothetical protein